MLPIPNLQNREEDLVSRLRAKLDGNGQMKTLAMAEALACELRNLTTPEQVCELFRRIEDHYQVISKYGYRLADAIADVLAGKDGQ